MIIGASNVGMNANRSFKSNSRQISYLEAWDNGTGAMLRYMNGAADSFVSEDKTGGGLEESTNKQFAKVKEEEEKAQAEALSENENSVAESTKENDKNDNLLEKAASDLKYSLNSVSRPKVDSISEKIEQMKRLRQQTINYLLRMIFGRDWRNYSASNMTDGMTSGQTDENQYYYLDQGDASDYSSMSGTGYLDSSKFMEDGEICFDNLSQGVGGSYYNYFEYSEKESVEFNTKGTVVTADGREIEFNVSLSMSRSFYQASETYIDFGQAKCIDPLVINLDGNVTSVEDQKFFFDLDADGHAEEISRLSKGSGYIALDRNGDGIINDGSELFGTQTGNGFADLAKYDLDGNGWIDEADEIFEKLVIWQMDEKGESSLVGVGKAGIGAIYLGSEDTEFALKDQMNNTNAVVRKTGLFMYEDGNVGTMSQLDLAT